MSQQPEDKTTELVPSWIEKLPEGIRAETGTGMAHDLTPVRDIVGNTARVGNIMLVRLDPEKTSQSAFRKLAMHVEEFLERVASVSS